MPLPPLLMPTGNPGIIDQLINFFDALNRRRRMEAVRPELMRQLGLPEATPYEAAEQALPAVQFAREQATLPGVRAQTGALVNSLQQLGNTLPDVFRTLNIDLPVSRLTQEQLRTGIEGERLRNLGEQLRNRAYEQTLSRTGGVLPEFYSTEQQRALQQDISNRSMLLESLNALPNLFSPTTMLMQQVNPTEYGEFSGLRGRLLSMLTGQPLSQTQQVSPRELLSEQASAWLDKNFPWLSGTTSGMTPEQRNVLTALVGTQGASPDEIRQILENELKALDEAIQMTERGIAQAEQRAKTALSPAMLATEWKTGSSGAWPRSSREELERRRKTLRALLELFQTTPNK